MKIYYSHPYGGKPANAEAVDTQLKALMKKHKILTNCAEIVLVSPIHALGWAYEAVRYHIGMEMCYALLKDCDAMVYIAGTESNGVMLEKEYCYKHGIPVVEYFHFDRILDDCDLANSTKPLTDVIGCTSALERLFG